MKLENYLEVNLKLKHIKINKKVINMQIEEVEKILISYRDANVKNRRVCPHCESCYFGINEVVDKLIKEIEENEKEC